MSNNKNWDELVKCCGVEDFMETPEGIMPMCRVTPVILSEFLDKIGYEDERINQ